MSSLVERLRVRSDKRPRYTLDESDDDFPPRGGNGKGKDRDGDAPVKQIEREDANRQVFYIDQAVSMIIEEVPFLAEVGTERMACCHHCTVRVRSLDPFLEDRNTKHVFYII